LKGLHGDIYGRERVDGLRGENRFDKRHPPGNVEISSMERREVCCRFVFDILEVRSFEALHRKREIKVFHKKGHGGSRKVL
jgi:hypothetical protein